MYTGKRFCNGDQSVRVHIHAQNMYCYDMDNDRKKILFFRSLSDYHVFLSFLRRICPFRVACAHLPCCSVYVEINLVSFPLPSEQKYHFKVISHMRDAYTTSLCGGNLFMAVTTEEKNGKKIIARRRGGGSRPGVIRSTNPSPSFAITTAAF